MRHLSKISGLKLTYFIGIIFFGFSALGQGVDIPIRPNDRLQIKGDHIELNWRVEAGPTLKVRGLSESQGVRRGDLLMFDLKDSISKDQFRASAAAKGPPTKVYIVGPSMPVDLSLREGQINLENPAHDVRILMVEGGISINKSQGSLLLRLHSGTISVSNAQGKLSLDVYSGQVKLKDISDADVNLFNGNLSVLGLQGAMALNTYSVVSKISSMTGTLAIDSQLGSLSLDQFQGRLEGQINDGLVSGQILKNSEVQLKSPKGRFNFQLPSNSGSYLNLWTGIGDIYVPKELKVYRGPSEKFARGRLRGESQRISISVKTNEGVIVIK